MPEYWRTRAEEPRYAREWLPRFLDQELLAGIGTFGMRILWRIRNAPALLMYHELVLRSWSRYMAKVVLTLWRAKAQ